jgi:hypothetical protein
VNHKEIEEEASETHLQRKTGIEVGHLITLGLALLINAIVIAFSYGAMAQKVDTNTDAINLLKAQTITPGAERRISVLEVQMIQIQKDATDKWTSLERTMSRLEDKLDAHDAKKHEAN